MIAPEPNAPPSRIYAGMAGGAAAHPRTQGEQGDAACILQGHGPHGARFESGGSVAQVPGFGAGLLALRMADAIAPAGTVTVIADNREAMETIRNRRTRSTVTARRPHNLLEARDSNLLIAVSCCHTTCSTNLPTRVFLDECRNAIGLPHTIAKPRCRCPSYICRLCRQHWHSTSGDDSVRGTRVPLCRGRLLHSETHLGVD